MARLREEIQIVRLGNKDPFQEFIKEADAAFRALLTRFDEEIIGVFERLDVEDGDPSVESLGLRRPSSTWTYLVDDSPFRNAVTLHVSGNLGLSLGAAIYSPLYIAAGLYRRYFKKTSESQPS